MADAFLKLFKMGAPNRRSLGALVAGCVGRDRLRLAVAPLEAGQAVNDLWDNGGERPPAGPAVSRPSPPWPAVTWAG